MKKYSGMDYLRIDVASQYGLDKELFETRIQWVHDNEPDLEELEEKADDFFRYAAAVVAYRQAQQGVATGHLVGLDACASGPQILSVISGCEIGARNTGAIGQIRADIYGKQTEVMNGLLEDMEDYPRKTVKDALMPHYYGSVNEPVMIFGEDTPELAAFLQAADIVCPGANALLKVMINLWDPNALEYRWNLPDGFQVVLKVKDIIKSKIEVDTVEPHKVFEYVRTENSPLDFAVKLPANITHSIDGYIVRELVARCNYDIAQLRKVELVLTQQGFDHESGQAAPKPDMMMYIEQCWRKHGTLSLVGIDHINSWSVTQISEEYRKALLLLVRKTLQKPSFEVITIHDEFKCHPNYMNHVRQTYIDLLAELADSNILDAILSDVNGSPIHVEKLSKNLSKLIRQAEYPLA